jgi:hypothetical protein
MIEREVRTLLRRDPFEPFRIRLVNGEFYDVNDPELVATMDDGIYLVLQGGHWSQFPYDRVANLESLIVFQQ